MLAQGSLTGWQTRVSQGSLPLICGPACLHVLDSKSPEGCHEDKTHKHTMRLNAHFVKAVLASAAKNMGCVSTRAAYTYIILACVSCTAGSNLLIGHDLLVTYETAIHHVPWRTICIPFCTKRQRINKEKKTSHCCVQHQRKE